MKRFFDVIFFLTPLLFSLISLFPLLTIACIQTFENTTPIQMNDPVFYVNVTKSKKKVPFFKTKEEAYKLLQEKSISSQKDFRKRRSSDQELQQIPYSPYRYKPYNGWSWKKAHGSELIHTKEEAYKLLQRKGILTLEDFLWERPTDLELQRIYSHPYIYYNGWSWPEIRGEKKVEFLTTKEEAYELIRKKKILSRRDFERRRAFDQELQRIPRSPDKYKPYNGWSWLDAYGEKKSHK